MADHDDDEIGRKVVGALRGVVFAADLAVIGDFQKAPEQVAAPAIGALHRKAARQRLGEGDRLRHG